MASKTVQFGLLSLLASTIFAVPHAGGMHQHLHDRAEVVTTVTVTPGAPAPTPKSDVADTGSSSSGASKGKTSGSIGGIKAGLAYNDPSLLSAYGSKYSWCWNWGASSGGSTGSAKYVPMLKDVASEGAWSGLTSGFAGKVPAVLGYNEPDVNGISAEQAASSYPSLFTEPFGNTDTLIGTPGPTSSAGVGSVWLDTFLGACSSCKIDFAAVHWYANKQQSAEANAQAFISYITDTIEPIVQKYKTPQGNPLPIWIPEFGYVPPANDGGIPTNPADEVTFLEQVIPFLNKAESVAQYAFFMVGNDAGDMTGNVQSTYIELSD